MGKLDNKKATDFFYWLLVELKNKGGEYKTVDMGEFVRQYIDLYSDRKNAYDIIQHLGDSKFVSIVRLEGIVKEIEGEKHIDLANIVAELKLLPLGNNYILSTDTLKLSKNSFKTTIVFSALAAVITAANLCVTFIQTNNKDRQDEANLRHYKKQDETLNIVSDSLSSLIRRVHVLSLKQEEQELEQSEKP